MKITIIGHGYVGLVTACVFADFGNTVRVIGRTPEKIKKLNGGDPLIFEPGLEEILKRNLENGNLKFTKSYDSLSDSKIVFIAVGTPSMEDGSADLSQVKTVASQIGKNLSSDFTVVSCKSTVPVGTNLEVEKLVQENAPEGAKFAVASCPEFLREGTGVNDTLYPDRVIIGSKSQKAIDLLLELHVPVGGKRVVTDLASAELIKYSANSILATKISFANLIAEYCEKTGANAEVVLEAVGFDNRVSEKFLNVGIGYGGACFPKDVKALAYIGKTLGLDTALLDGVEDVNFGAKSRFVERVLRIFESGGETDAGGANGGGSKKKKLAIWGLSFKPNTDDIREAPSRYILERLLNEGFELSVYDPEAMGHIKAIFGDKLTYVDDKMKALAGAEGLLVLTEWNEFEAADLVAVKEALSEPIVVDGRNIFELEKMKGLGFKYYSVGRRDVK
jgi:UDPglucose 6-dehydrogenase